MSSQALFYERVTPVSKERHREISVEPLSDFNFAAGVNAVPIVTAEFGLVEPEYPIVFIQSGGEFQPMACMGLRTDENLFVDSKGQWCGRYIPAFVRRYPFVFGRTDDPEKFALCLDESHKGCNSSGSGDALFEPDGKPTEYLDQRFNFTREYQRSVNKTREFSKILRDLDLFDPIRVNFNLPNGDTAAIEGMQTVDQGKLRAQPDQKIAEMCRSGALELIYAHLASLRNFEFLREKLGKKIAQSTSA